MRNSKFKIFFLCELSLILGVDRKRNNEPKIFAEDPLDIECDRDWPVGLGTTLGDGQKIIKTIFLVSGIFPGKADSVILLGFECTINSQNLIKIVRAIFEIFEILIFFFLCEN